MIAGVLVGGWVADRTERHLPFVVVLTVVAAAVMLLVGIVVDAADCRRSRCCSSAGIMIGASRTPRDVMVKDAAPPGQIGKVFGFVSAGHVAWAARSCRCPTGMMIDAGRPDLVLVVVAALLLASLLCAGGARVGFRRAPGRRPRRITGRAKGGLKPQERLGWTTTQGSWRWLRCQQAFDAALDDRLTSRARYSTEPPFGVVGNATAAVRS